MKYVCEYNFAYARVIVLCMDYAYWESRMTSLCPQQREAVRQLVERQAASLSNAVANLLCPRNEQVCATQHTSAYVSTRQHPSAYASIRLCNTKEESKQNLGKQRIIPLSAVNVQPAETPARVSLPIVLEELFDLSARGQQPPFRMPGRGRL